MNTVNNDNFGLAIAYLIPGFVLLWGLSAVSEPVAGWLGANPTATASVGGFLYVTVASLALGVVASTIRWAVVDRLHHSTGLQEPALNFANLRGRFHAFEGLVRNHYRFYQFHANSLVAMLIAYGIRRAANGWEGALATDAAIAILALVLFLGSRDTLRKYYQRTRELLASTDGG